MEPITFIINDEMVAMALIANIQLATRHPKNTGPSRKIAEDFARRLGDELSKQNASLAPLIAMGWEPEHDVE